MNTLQGDIVNSNDNKDNVSNNDTNINTNNNNKFYSKISFIGILIFAFAFVLIFDKIFNIFTRDTSNLACMGYYIIVCSRIFLINSNPREIFMRVSDYCNDLKNKFFSFFNTNNLAITDIQICLIIFICLNILDILFDIFNDFGKYLLPLVLIILWGISLTKPNIKIFK